MLVNNILNKPAYFAVKQWSNLYCIRVLLVLVRGFAFVKTVSPGRKVFNLPNGFIF